MLLPVSTLMPLKRREIEHLLQTKFGFVEAEGRSDDHRWYTLRLDDDLPEITTKFSHSDREIGKKLEGMIARQFEGF